MSTFYFSSSKKGYKYSRTNLLYPSECSPRVLLKILGFWMRFNSKTSKSGLFSKKVRFHSRKTPKSGLFKVHGLALLDRPKNVSRVENIE